MKRRSTMLSTIQKDPERGAYTPEPGRDQHRVNAPCCAKCRRGIRGYGELPCGYPDGCPNPNCAHAKEKR